MLKPIKYFIDLWNKYIDTPKFLGTLCTVAVYIYIFGLFLYIFFWKVFHYACWVIVTLFICSFFPFPCICEFL